MCYLQDNITNTYIQLSYSANNYKIKYILCVHTYTYKGRRI